MFTIAMKRAGSTATMAFWKKPPQQQHSFSATRSLVNNRNRVVFPASGGALLRMYGNDNSLVYSIRDNGRKNKTWFQLLHSSNIRIPPAGWRKKETNNNSIDEDGEANNSNKKPTSTTSSLVSRGVGLAAGLSLLAGKTKYLVGILKLTKMSSLISILASVGGYTMIFGFPFAVGMVGQLIFHESGHALAMHHYKIPFSPMMFIPFVGAVVTMEKNALNCEQEAYIALAGPMAGLAAASGLTLAGMATNNQLLFALADFGYIINLFNLLPIGSLDGGRATSAISPYFQIAGLGIGGSLIYFGFVQSPLFYLIMFFAMFNTYERFSNQDKRYHRIPNSSKFVIGSGYLGLIFALLVGMGVNNSRKKSVKELKGSNKKDTVFDEWIYDEEEEMKQFHQVPPQPPHNDRRF